MKKRKKRKKSLTKAIQRLVLIMALIIFLASALLNWTFLKDEFGFFLWLSSHNAAVGIEAKADQLAGFEDFAKDVMKTYSSVPEKIRQEQGEEYFAYFEEYEKSDFYRHALETLKETSSSFLFERTYLAMYDRKTMACVYLLDPGSDNPSSSLGESRRVGEWKSADQEELDTFFYDENEKYVIHHTTARTESGKKLITGGIQIRDEEGNIYAFALADIPSRFSGMFASIFSVLYLVVLMLVVLLIVAAVRLIMGRRIIKPVRRISGAAEKYVKNKKEGKTDISCFKTLEIRTGDELEELGRVMADMETDIDAYEENMMKAVAEQEKIHTELNVAARIQDDLLPTIFPPFPDREEFEIYAVMDPAREVGGDFYDFFFIDHDHLALVIADVSGKGIPASLVMMSSMIIIENYASEGYSPAEILAKTNRKICATRMADMFVTAWFGILDLNTGVITAANAGHEYPAVRHGDGGFELYKDRHGFVLGGLKEVKYRDYTMTLEKGDALFVYTDGVPEATNTRDEMFGTGRMLQALNRKRSDDPQEMLQTVKKDVEDFVQDAPQFDDLTMLCIVYKG